MADDGSGETMTEKKEEKKVFCGIWGRDRTPKTSIYRSQKDFEFQIFYLI